VVRVAQQFFDFASTDSIKLHVADGRVFVKRKLLADERYDIIILVAFGKDWTPEHLSTQEFLLEVKDLMGENAVFVAHSRAKNRLKDSLFTTYQSVFGEFYQIRTDGCCPLLFAMKQPYPAREEIFARLPELIEPMQAVHVSIDDYVGELTQRVDWDITARVLTDNYVPGHLLQSMSP